MIEIISVLVIIGIISAVVVSRVSSRDSYSLASETAILKTHLRYAQSRAMSDTVSWGITFSSASYELKRYGSSGTTSNYLPGEDGSTHTLQGGVTVPADTAPDTVFFDVWGAPGTTNGTLATADITITLSVGGISPVITVTKNTGFIP